MCRPSGRSIPVEVHQQQAVHAACRRRDRGVRRPQRADRHDEAHQREGRDERHERGLDRVAGLRRADHALVDRDRRQRPRGRQPRPAGGWWRAGSGVRRGQALTADDREEQQGVPGGVEDQHGGRGLDSRRRPDHHRRDVAHQPGGEGHEGRPRLPLGPDPVECGRGDRDHQDDEHHVGGRRRHRHPGVGLPQPLPRHVPGRHRDDGGVQPGREPRCGPHDGDAGAVRRAGGRRRAWGGTPGARCGSRVRGPARTR